MIATELAPGTPGGGARVLHPGDVACAERGGRLETLLGSCVAIILTDPRRTVGAMCHFVHANSGEAAARRDCTHAEAAIGALYHLLGARGITPALCEAYVYGGGNMFPDLVPPLSVGDRNAEWALDRLAGAGIRVVHHDVGGTAYRRLAWTVGTGLPELVAVPAGEIGPRS